MGPRDPTPDPDGLDARWCGDITYVATGEGWLYLATVIDIASRRVVGWATADHPRTDPVADALTAACRQRRPSRPAIFDFIEGWYSLHRLHSSPGYRSPADCETALTA
ncbi:DDE-type integrase/transposase/recombinase [Streptomyces sp. NPDC001744]|uniref:DDE-type integrase/transposase/recombinase n=1 Tax=Streptomyces sp. NPDC001744 TaxID=3364606 RepID=UPI00369D60FC